MSTANDDDRRLVQRLARRTGLKTRGPAGAPLLPTCEYPTVDSGDRDRSCGRIATHSAWYPDKPSGLRDYCAYHAIEAAGTGETFEPTLWLSEVGKDHLADMAEQGRRKE